MASGETSLLSANYVLNRIDSKQADALTRSHRIATIIIFLANIADLFTTYKVLSKGGVELNPLSKLLLGHSIFGIDILIYAKVAIISAIVYGAYHMRETTLRIVCASWFVAGIYTLIPILNTMTYFTKYS